MAWLRKRSPFFMKFTASQLRPVALALTLVQLSPCEQLVHTEGRLYFCLSGSILLMRSKTHFGVFICCHVYCRCGSAQLQLPVLSVGFSTHTRTHTHTQSHTRHNNSKCCHVSVVINQHVGTNRYNLKCAEVRLHGIVCMCLQKWKCPGCGRLSCLAIESGWR